MFAVVTPEKIQLSPGTVVKLLGTWQDYEILSQKLGDRAATRIKYRPGEILLMVPLPEHGRNAHLIANVVTVFLDYLEQDYEAFTPITIKLPQESGIEPDYCFYIDNWAAVAGKKRINWGVDPSPDLVIEIDVTSYTKVNDYLPHKVPEVWILKENRLNIYLLQNGVYNLQTSSRYFPNLDIVGAIARCLQVADRRNSSTAIRELRQQLQQEK